MTRPPNRAREQLGVSKDTVQRVSPKVADASLKLTPPPPTTAVAKGIPRDVADRVRRRKAPLPIPECPAAGVGGKKILLGLFSTPEAAHAAYYRAAQKYFGEFARGMG